MLLTSRSSLGHPTLAAQVYSMQKRIRIAPGSRLEDAGGDGRAGYSARKARLQRILGRSFVSSSRSYGSLGLAEICSGLGPCASRILPILFQRPPMVLAPCRRGAVKGHRRYRTVGLLGDHRLPCSVLHFTRRRGHLVKNRPGHFSNLTA